MRKMRAHAISYKQPIPKILPPPKEDIEEVLAIMFTGPCKPSAADFKRTPFLIRRNHVKKALEWLVLNHCDYEGVTISVEHLSNYPEDMPPVSIEYKEIYPNKIPEGTSVHDMEVEDGTSEGECTFTVHGLTGEDLNIMTTNAVKAKALQHLNSQGKFLAVGHSAEPESIWNNPQLYPQMFPWLFPYGLGGIGSVPGIPEREHKRRLLMYHDKRFQVDQDFPFIAFSHEQIKTASTQSYLLADKRMFKDISNRILSVDRGNLTTLLEHMAKNGVSKPETDDEKKCFQLLQDLDHVAGPIKGSNTSKKWMRNEIWSLIYHRGAPFWYITISPADNKHPFCIYYADSQQEFKEEALPYDERLRLVCKNPVAGARFFHFMVELFIGDVLGIGANHQGLYGEVATYYGTVEQQGRLALHLHSVVWLKGNLTPQEIRRHIKDPESNFQRNLIAWLESCHIGEFITGTQQDVLGRVAEKSKSDSYKDPTETLPTPPLPPCPKDHPNIVCPACIAYNRWWQYFESTVDDIISKSNIHNCERGINKDGTFIKKYASCMDNKFGKCKACFPRPIVEATEVDSETGAISMKKLEPWTNFVTPVLTFLEGCNTDVTCMFSGTALKAVIQYICDYVTKAGLKTHVVFEAIRSVFDKHQEILTSTLSDKEKARQIVNKIVNALSVKLEMGGPMVCMYLLGNPDHYTDHKFVPFFWYSFILEAQKAWEEPDTSTYVEKVALIRTKKGIVGHSPVYDYIFRASELENISLYEWALWCVCQKYKKNSKKYNPLDKKDVKETLFDDNENKVLKKSLYNESEDEIQNADGSGNESSTRAISDTDEHDHNIQQEYEDGYIPKVLPKNKYRFKPEHPFHTSHILYLHPINPKWVVNFIGRSLPRCDQGDREFYCLTMLALFKPWRTGMDLKNKDKSWDETFNGHNFTPRQRQLMGNFNIKYECLDARDNFRAKMKASSIDEMPIEFEGDNFDDDQIPEGDPLVQASIGSEYPEIVKLSLSEIRRQKEATEIKDVLRRTGWLDEVVNIDENLNTKQVEPQCTLSPHTWKSIVQQKRQAIVEKEKITISRNIAMPESFAPNQIKIVDKSYLEKTFHSPEHKNSIDTICNEFQLNEEQEHAFKIIANHVVLPSSEQLKMYIGGMGGTGKTQVLKAVCKFFESCCEE